MRCANGYKISYVTQIRKFHQVANNKIRREDIGCKLLWLWVALVFSLFQTLGDRFPSAWTVQRQRSYPATAECAWSGAERDSLFWRCLKCKTRVCWGSTSIYARHQQQIQLSWQDPVWSLYWDANLSESFFDHLMTQWGLLHTAVPIVFKLCHGLCWPNRCPDVLQTDLHHRKAAQSPKIPSKTWLKVI